MDLNICHLYPDLLNVYGDVGNILILKHRAEVELKVFLNHIYELKKGVRQMVLYTTKRKYEDFAVKRLINQKINYIIQPVGNDKINLFFGRKECINAIRFLVNQPLNKLSPEQDFILGAMLGYDICAQCKRYCDRKV